MKKSVFGLLAAGFLAIVFFSCEKHTIEYPEVIIPDTVSFATDIQPIFDAKCVSCHKGLIHPDLRPANSFAALTEGGYINPGTPENSRLVTKLGGDHSDRSSAADRELILTWIQQGGLNN